jgi:hypothetical protein
MSEYDQETIGGNEYDVYATLAQGNTYMGAAISAAGTAWGDASDDTKKKALVSSTRWIDQGNYLGEKVDEIHQWPRTGIDGVDEDEIPVLVQYACIELAGALLVDTDAKANLSAPLAKEQHAGSAGITYFRPSSVQISSFFPPEVMNILKPYLGGSGSGAVGAIAHDVCGDNPLYPPFDVNRGF